MGEMESKSAKNLLFGLLEERGLKVEALEATTTRDAVASVYFPTEGVRTVTAEVAGEGSGLWSRDSDPLHPCRFSFPGGLPVPASKAESVTASFIHVNFSPDGRSAILLLGEDLPKHGKLQPAAEGKEAVFVIPLSCCLVLHRDVCRALHADENAFFCLEDVLEDLCGPEAGQDTREL